MDKTFYLKDFAMDIYTIVSILLILFVGFYDLIVNRLKKYKFSDENIDNALQTTNGVETSFFKHETNY